MSTTGAVTHQYRATPKTHLYLIDRLKSSKSRGDNRETVVVDAVLYYLEVVIGYKSMKTKKIIKDTLKKKSTIKN